MSRVSPSVKVSLSWTSARTPSFEPPGNEGVSFTALFPGCLVVQILPGVFSGGKMPPATSGQRPGATTQFTSPGGALIIRTRFDSTLISGMCNLCPLEIYTSGRTGVPPFIVGACSTGAVTFATSFLPMSLV